MYDWNMLHISLPQRNDQRALNVVMGRGSEDRDRTERSNPGLQLTQRPNVCPLL